MNSAVEISLLLSIRTAEDRAGGSSRVVADGFVQSTGTRSSRTLSIFSVVFAEKSLVPAQTIRDQSEKFRNSSARETLIQKPRFGVLKPEKIHHPSFHVWF
jgi:hypothetical protein